ncbi:type II toxin-antitoxin system VapC family toxin [Goekera deserti]|uniref:type II toxin-antitoxin system VapC family toxin n=1 Tax=Goekera deserti TaxID=2497753 RepID=UPI001F384C5D|nr:type II toxin-antitoxin system VapC family toxin [Goekera deserti]
MTTVAGKGLLDTNAVILLARLQVADLPGEVLISTVTLAELSAGPLLAGDPVERSTRQAHLQQAEADFEALPVDAATARAFGRVAADMRAAGRKPSARAFDALIAATAIANGLPLYTVNPDDFASVSELTVHAIPHPDRA